MQVLWVGSTLVVVTVLVVVALARAIRIGPLSALLSLFGAGALLAGLDGECPPRWVVAVIVCAAIAGADQLHRWATGRGIR